MNRRITRMLSLLVIFAMIFSMTVTMTSCSNITDLFQDKKEKKHSRHKDDDDEDETEETDETEPEETEPVETEPVETEPVETEPVETEPTETPTPSAKDGIITGANGLTYPDHIATTEEIHPGHKPGNVKGKDAEKLLSEVELRVIGSTVDCYIDAVLDFEHPENYGINIDDVTWGDFWVENVPDNDFIDGVLQDLYSIDYETLEGDDRIFYDKIVYDFEEEAYGAQFTAFTYIAPYLNWLTSIQCEVLFIMEVIPVTTVEEAENYILLVKDTDRYFDQILDFEEKRVEYGYADADEQYEKIAESFDNFAEMKDNCFLYDSFAEKVGKIKGISDEDKERLIAENEAAMKEVFFPEMEECAQRMRALEGSGGEYGGICQYPGGTEYYVFLCRAKTNSALTIEEQLEKAQKNSDIVKDFFSTLYSDTDWLAEYMDHQYGSDDTKENLDFLRETVKDDFPDIPEHDYFMMEVPEELSENMSPAAYLGYHLDNYNDNMILVNRSSVSAEFGTVCAHEGYPGHMFQSLYTRAATDHPYMYLFDSIGYAEGWATYVQYYSYNYFAEPGKGRDVVIMEDLLNSMAFLRMDYGVNYEGWTKEDCNAYFKDVSGMSLPSSNLDKIYDIISLEPTYGVKYGMGFILTNGIIQDMKEKYPDATDKEIHTAYLDALTGTFEQIRANTDRELSEKK